LPVNKSLIIFIDNSYHEPRAYMKTTTRIMKIGIKRRKKILKKILQHRFSFVIKLSWKVEILSHFYILHMFIFNPSSHLISTLHIDTKVDQFKFFVCYFNKIYTLTWLTSFHFFKLWQIFLTPRKQFYGN
jgi:uncharacterized membrane protein